MGRGTRGLPGRGLSGAGGGGGAAPEEKWAGLRPPLGTARTARASSELLISFLTDQDLPLPPQMAS